MRVHPHRRSTAMALTAALATLALVAPAAPARPVEQFLGQPSSQNASIGEASSASLAPDPAPDPGFNWGAAAIGAGTAVGLLALGWTAAIAFYGRRPVHTAR
jgi:hypothetical protein